MSNRRRLVAVFLQAELTHFFYQRGSAHLQSLRSVGDDPIGVIKRLADKLGLYLREMLFKVEARAR